MHITQLQIDIKSHIIMYTNELSLKSNVRVRSHPKFKHTYIHTYIHRLQYVVWLHELIKSVCYITSGERRPLMCSLTHWVWPRGCPAITHQSPEVLAYGCYWNKQLLFVFPRLYECILSFFTIHKKITDIQLFWY